MCAIGLTYTGGQFPVGAVVNCQSGSYFVGIHCTLFGPPPTTHWYYGPDVTAPNGSGAVCPRFYVIHGTSDVAIFTDGPH